MLAPASVQIMAESVSGIINLTSFDKEKIASKLRLDSITNSQVFQSLDGVALSAIGILLIVIFLLIVIAITRKSPKVFQFFTRIRDIIFWNFLIRYFQASFIGFNFAALTVIQKRNGGL